MNIRVFLSCQAGTAARPSSSNTRTETIFPLISTQRFTNVDCSFNGGTLNDRSEASCVAQKALIESSMNLSTVAPCQLENGDHRRRHWPTCDA